MVLIHTGGAGTALDGAAQTAADAMIARLREMSNIDHRPVREGAMQFDLAAAVEAYHVSRHTFTVDYKTVVEKENPDDVSIALIVAPENPEQPTDYWFRLRVKDITTKKLTYSKKLYLVKVHAFNKRLKTIDWMYFLPKATRFLASLRREHVLTEATAQKEDTFSLDKRSLLRGEVWDDEKSPNEILLSWELGSREKRVFTQHHYKQALVTLFAEDMIVPPAPQ